MNKLIILLLCCILILSSCSVEPSVPETDLNNIVVLNNLFSELLLTELTNPYSTIINIENISDVLIIELNYSLNGKEYTILKAIVPKEKIQLYYTKQADMTIVCTIIGVITY